MKRYYYTDPLKSAWMAREFGVKFISHGGADLIYNGGDDFSVIDCPRGHYVGEYYHVHPDILPIFEPKVGDLCSFVAENDTQYGKLVRAGFSNWRGEFRRKIPKNAKFPEEYEPWYEFDNWDDPNTENHIVIQRDNKAFFMPEVEE